MSPINTITEPSFTNTSKGLMTLFCIGLFHLIIGVDLTSTEIAIPWLPSVNFPNTDRLPILFWILVFFTMYRYCLHNLDAYRYNRFLAYKDFFVNSSYGLAFIKKEIFDNEKELEVTTKGEGDGENDKIITIGYRSDYGHGVELLACINFVFDSAFKYKSFEFFENPDYIHDEFKIRNQETRKKWGLIYKEVDEEGNIYKYYGRTINGLWLKAQFIHLILRQLFIITLTNKEVFDAQMPVLLNVLLFLAWLYIY